MKFSGIRKTLEPWAARTNKPFLGFLLSKGSLLNALISNWQSRWGDKVDDYSKAPVAIDRERNASDILEEGTSFYVRICLEFGYQHLIDIGALNGERALHVKHLLPNIEVTGLDISPSYNEQQIINAVTFERFSLDYFRQRRSKGVVMANIALTYFPPAELLEFFKILRAYGYAIALREPQPIFYNDEDLRRSRNSYYHNFDRALRLAGYTDITTNHHAMPMPINLGAAERWLLLHAAAGN